MIPSSRAAVLRCCIVTGALVTFVLIMWMVSDSRSGAWAATVESRVPGPVCHAKCDYLRQPGPADDENATRSARRVGCYPESIRLPQSGWIMSRSTFSTSMAPRRVGRRLRARPRLRAGR